MLKTQLKNILKLKSKRILLIPLLFSVALPLNTAIADDAALTKDKCGTCHGDDGNSKDSKVPSIAGFSAATIDDIMTQYKSGDREGDKYTPEGGKETDMGTIAKDLSDEDSKKISAYLATQKFVAVKQDFDAALAKKGEKKHKKKCEKCHSDNGANAEDDAAILAGQHRAYLEKEFAKIAAKERDTPKKMKKKFKKLKEDQRKALIEFYISQQ